MPRTRSRIAATISSVALGATTIVGGALVALPSASAAPDNTQTWSTPGAYDFVVPAGVTSVTIEAVGAGGGAGGGLANPDGLGGDGGLISGEFVVTPGETLKVNVGGRGSNGDDGAAGGFNGGGNGGHTPGGCPQITWGGGGGGASDVRRGGTALANRILVAGGGGGGGTGAFAVSGAYGGDGGNAPADGANGSYLGNTAVGGRAPVGSAGGLGGSGGTVSVEVSGSTGALGTGGNGASSTYCTFLSGFMSSGGGGGGGGGSYGAGGGAAGNSHPVSGAGGGGSSSWVPTGNTLSANTTGVNAGEGEVTISWNTPPVTTTTTVPTTPTPTFDCPSPSPALRVFPNVFSVRVADYMIRHCGSTARATTASGRSVVVTDPPVGSSCPAWAALRVHRSRGSLLIAKHLLDSCRYTTRAQGDVVFVVPEGYPSGPVSG